MAFQQIGPYRYFNTNSIWINYDLFNPWEWFWAKNYRHENAYDTRGPAYTGADRYKVSFMSHPHVTTTVIIYDR